MTEKVFVEKHKAGSGYDIQDSALQRLGEEAATEFSHVHTSGDIFAFAEKWGDKMTEEELKEFNGYGDYIGLLFGYQDSTP